jgi:uncharacterized membrane protein
MIVILMIHVHRRALAKTISWRGISLLFTTLGVWLVTGRWCLAASVGLAEIAVKFGGYYLHECFWDWVDLHRLPKPLSFFRSLSKNNEEQPCQQPYYSART